MIRLLLLLGAAAAVLWLAAPDPEQDAPAGRLRADALVERGALALERAAERARALADEVGPKPRPQDSSEETRDGVATDAPRAEEIREEELDDAPAVADLAPAPTPDRVEPLRDPVEAPSPVAERAEPVEPLVTEAPDARPASERVMEGDAPARAGAEAFTSESAAAVHERLDRVMDLAAGRGR